ncbi:hypothetical protein C2G38_2055599 [Gigaspora rosea]|uniref:MD-2-related lipid-recognition domain-containing protein n=1 Tax=Gigaspora rosea TaxID=44941 RepID=A0A397WCK2_9GLOM|nr:hypothetical protein C2G38_2055599 [Gigaspora rosea]
MKIFIFIFILFATLYTVNTAPHQFYKRTTDFIRCNAAFPGLNVRTIPDPLVAGQNATFTVVGTQNYPIDQNKTILEISFHDDVKLATLYDKPFDKSFPPNTTFWIKASDVPVPSGFNETSLWTIMVTVSEWDPKLIFLACEISISY